MKLTSRSIKVGDRIIRKAPTAEGEKSYMETVVQVVKKTPHYTNVMIHYFGLDKESSFGILNHSTWNDNNWVRFK
jgi:hypothetical protein